MHKLAHEMASLRLPEDWHDVPAEFAVACLDSLLSPNEWVHRRKSSAELLTLSLARRRLTLDLEVPESAPRLLSGKDERFLVPIGILRKAPGAFTQFDLASHRDDSLRLSSRKQNAALSAAVLIEQARRVLSTSTVDNDPALLTILEYVAISDPETPSRL